MAQEFSPNEYGLVLTAKGVQPNDINPNQDDVERTAKSLTPTETICRELQGAFSIYNRTLFDGQLPECMLTIDHSGKTVLGYFSPSSFVSATGEIIHQISMNPSYLLSRDIGLVLSTLVHEQCHLAIHESSDRKPTNGYHCRRWAQLMLSVGLFPTHDGTLNGKQTGFRMTHLIIKDGPFDKITDDLLKRGFALTWGAAMDLMTGTKPNDKQGGNKSSVNGPKPDRSKGKVKFACPQCGKAAWAAASRKLICGDDHCNLVIEQRRNV